MSFLLKIVEGPMKGAEIALVEGLRVRVGSGDACDIVIADGALPTVAFELDVTSEAVSLIVDGSAKTLRPFEVVSVGTTEFAIGPAEGVWEPLVRPAPAAEASPAEPPVAEASDPSPADPAPESVSASAADGTPSVEERESVEERKGHGCLVGLVLLLILLLVACGLVWWFWPRVAAACPWAERARIEVVETVRGWWGQKSAAPVAEEKTPSLEEIARVHGLTLDRNGDVPVLRGNVARRTERLAIRALAFAGDRTVQFDLTDDETLRAASDELLFVVAEGHLKATAASNRVVTLAGYAPSPAALEKAVRALDQDVKGIDRLVTKDVRVGGLPPPRLGAEKAVFEEPSPEPKAPRARGVAADPAKDLPVAGILTVPYPCVVLRNGMRVAEGAQIGGATVEKIESGRLVLRNGTTTFEWRP